MARMDKDIEKLEPSYINDAKLKYFGWFEKSHHRFTIWTSTVFLTIQRVREIQVDNITNDI